MPPPSTHPPTLDPPSSPAPSTTPRHAPPAPLSLSRSLALSLPKTLRIALAHDWLVGLRGGELVLDRLARLIADDPAATAAALLAMFDDGRPLTPAIDALAHVVPPIGRRRAPAGPARRWLLPVYPSLVAQLGRELNTLHEQHPIDLLLSTSSAAIKNLRPPHDVPHLCYCHSPARWVWSQRADSARGSIARRAGLAAASRPYRRWDRAATAGVTRLLANSTHTAEQIYRCYRREAHVVHPPVRTDYFTPDASVQREDFWLVVSALEPYKRIDLAIDAAAHAGARLVIAGDGSQRRILEARANDEARGLVTFTGRVSDEQLRTLYRSARLLIFPQVEDFGIVAVEAQACGCPVLARAAGGALDTVSDGATGALFNDPHPAAIADAATRIPTDATTACRANAERFSEAAFDAAIAHHIAETLP